MTAKDNTISFIFGIPGLVLQGLGGYLHNPASSSIVILLGLSLLVVGLMFYAKGKGHHPAWGLMGLLSILGWIVLACFEDWNTMQDSKTTCGVNAKELSCNKDSQR